MCLYYTMVVLTRQEGGGNMAKSKLINFNKKIADNVVKGYKVVEDTMVKGYKKIEDTVVDGYKSIEDRFVDQYLTRDGESVEDAKRRLNNQK